MIASEGAPAPVLDRANQPAFGEIEVQYANPAMIAQKGRLYLLYADGVDQVVVAKVYERSNQYAWALFGGRYQLRLDLAAKSVHFNFDNVNVTSYGHALLPEQYEEVLEIIRMFGMRMNL